MIQRIGTGGRHTERLPQHEQNTDDRLADRQVDAVGAGRICRRVSFPSMVTASP
ncbi:hypothetical protein OHT57_01145 [Streptomyces sp. NBC_00285]|uniref:hypothetical protein n=1 Tax=Streptomyces sp. NBC_00285 TaxID=2975700 RepID=UPI002E29256C|nr:hypothetical protein [Streptomyces sp. NBC_00285]